MKQVTEDLYPVGSRLLLRRIQEVESSIIEIPDEAKQHSAHYVVLKTGPECQWKEIQPGMIVFLGVYSAKSLDLRGDMADWYICNEEDVLAVGPSEVLEVSDAA